MVTKVWSVTFQSVPRASLGSCGMIGTGGGEAKLKTNVTSPSETRPFMSSARRSSRWRRAAWPALPGGLLQIEVAVP